MEEPVWYQADWHWNPIDMVAKPAESKMKGAKMGAREKSVASEYSDEQRLQKAGCQVRELLYQLHVCSSELNELQL